MAVGMNAHKDDRMRVTAIVGSYRKGGIIDTGNLGTPYRGKRNPDTPTDRDLRFTSKSGLFIERNFKMARSPRTEAR